MDRDFEATLAAGGGDAAPDTGVQRAPRRSWREFLLQAVRGGRDPRSGLLTSEALLRRGEPLVARSRRGQAAMVLFDFHDLPDARQLYGRRASEQLVERIGRGMEKLAGRAGLAARTGSIRFAVLLPGLTLQQALDATGRVLGHPCRIEADVAGDDCVLVPDVAADICEAEPGSISALLDELGQRLDNERRRQLRHKVSVRRERQRHSRPMPMNAG